MSDREVLLQEFRDYIRHVYPAGLAEDSPQFIDLRRAFFAGALILLELQSRPLETEEQAIAWCQSIVRICREEANLAKIQTQGVG